MGGAEEQFGLGRDLGHRGLCRIIVAASFERTTVLLGGRFSAQALLGGRPDEADAVSAGGEEYRREEVTARIIGGPTGWSAGRSGWWSWSCGGRWM